MATGVDMSIEGDAFKALQRKIRAMPDAKALTRELNKALREGAKGIPKAAQDAARESLPKTGGLNEAVAARPVKLGVGSAKSSAGIRVRYTKTDPRMYEQGRLRHPVFGNKEVYVTQTIKSGWFSAAMRTEATRVKPELLRAMNRIAEKVARTP